MLLLHKPSHHISIQHPWQYVISLRHCCGHLFYNLLYLLKDQLLELVLKLRQRLLDCQGVPGDSEHSEDYCPCRQTLISLHISWPHKGPLMNHPPLPSHCPSDRIKLFRTEQLLCKEFMARGYEWSPVKLFWVQPTGCYGSFFSWEAPPGGALGTLLGTAAPWEYIRFLPPSRAGIKILRARALLLLSLPQFLTPTCWSHRHI